MTFMHNYGALSHVAALFGGHISAYFFKNQLGVQSHPVSDARLRSGKILLCVQSHP